MMDQVQRIPVTFAEEIDTVFSVFPQGKVSPFLDNKILGRRLDHLFSRVGRGALPALIVSRKGRAGKQNTKVAQKGRSMIMFVT